MDSKQLSLLSPEEWQQLGEQERRIANFKQGIYSGIDVKQKRPDLYELTITLIAEGKLSEVQISKRTGLCRNVIRGIKSEQQPDIEQVKKEIAAQSFDAAQMTVEAYRERMMQLLSDPGALAKVSPDRLSLAYCQMVDKGLIASGEATQRIESIDGHSGADDFERQLRALQAADVEELPAMDSAAEYSPAKGGEDCGAGGLVAMDDRQPGGVAVALETSDEVPE